MKIICSLPFTVRVGFWLLVTGFVLGLLAGYQTGAAGPAPVAGHDSPGDARASARVVDSREMTVPGGYPARLGLAPYPSA